MLVENNLVSVHTGVLLLLIFLFVFFIHKYSISINLHFKYNTEYVFWLVLKKTPENERRHRNYRQKYGYKLGSHVPSVPVFRAKVAQPSSNTLLVNKFPCSCGSLRMAILFQFWKTHLTHIWPSHIKVIVISDTLVWKKENSFQKSAWTFWSQVAFVNTN